MKTFGTCSRFQFILITISVVCIRRTVDTADCAEFSWPCDSGDQCIAEVDRCDGIRHCTDGSDETVTNCIQRRSNCNRYNFRCTYGACIVRKLLCNGQNDCADGSDELPAHCNKEQWAAELRGSCPSLESKCGSGECISQDNLCDGHADCADGSDESLAVCAAYYCPNISFRCGYGGCVNGDAACDGKADCFDASDESPVMCNTGPATTATTTTVTPTPVTTTTPKTVSVPQNTCRVPFTKYRLKTENALTGVSIPLETPVRSNTPLQFSCEAGFVLKGTNNSICRGGDVWTKNLPDCLYYCSDKHPRSGFSTKVNFELNGDVSHKSSFEPGTVARITCASFYLKPKYFKETITCKDYGWSTAKVACDMRCGQPEDQITRFSKGGVTTNITEVPWHVGLYRKNGGSYENFCAGTLISPRVVVSAAHCFFDRERTEFTNNDWSSYSVAAGKFYREYDREEVDVVERRNIKDVWTPQGYKGAENGFYRDISIITLERFMTFSDTIRPACLYISEEANQYIRSKVPGRVSAWSQTKRNLESTLQTLHMETVAHDQCNETLSRESFINVRGDKFCLASYGAEAVACKGDSGSGFVVRGADGTYALFGVVSYSPTKTQECSRDHLLVMTNALFYTSLLQDARDKDLADDVDDSSLMF